MTPATIRVILADDHPIVLNGIHSLLAEETTIHTVATVRNFAELLSTLGRTEADVVVLDLIGMDTAPLSMVMRLQREYPQLRYAIFSSSVDLAPELIQAGVQSYVAKEELVGHLVKAIKAAYGGNRYLSPVVQRSIERAQTIGQRHQLAPREVEVLRLVAKGLSTKDIAQTLQIEDTTTQNYISKLKKKTGCRQRTQLVKWYQNNYNDL